MAARAGGPEAENLASQHGNFAAVQIDAGAVQPAAVLRDDEADQAGDILRGAEPRDPGLAAKLRAHRGFIDLDENVPGLGVTVNEDALKDFEVIE